MRSIRLDADAECGQTTGSSSLDAQKYVGWNESVLCCQLTDPANTSDVYAEACSEEIKLVPEANTRNGKTFL
nr:hypothetical protein BaRGS_013454 [Batillaria attramentaria]